MSDDDAPRYYWCLRHRRVESEQLCSADRRMGPYPSREAAEQYAETAQRRNEAWEAEDERWEGS
ncbi:MAG TPA: hypothetical protein VM307_12400 [Egibacteraceae bacterium]|nr:hypothetical protein [Egibacteraceae bacterium]